MRKFIFVVAIIMASTAVVSAQSVKELAKQQRELNDISMKLLNMKLTKDARKQEKLYKKQGWQVPAGGKTLSKQITEVQLLGEELMADDLGNPIKRYIIRSGHAVSGTYNAGIAAARANAQVELASMLQTKITAAMETKLDNQQTSAITAQTVDKFHERAKSIVDACLTNTNTVLTIYRVTAQNNYEVQIQVVYDKKELSSMLKKKLHQELEQEGDDALNEIIDRMMKEVL